MNKDVEYKPCTDQEKDHMYGEKTKPVGQAYRKNDGFYDHFYLQRESDVLHVNVKGQILNILHIGFLNKEAGLVEITNKEFTETVRKFIYLSEIEKFWG